MRDSNEDELIEVPVTNWPKFEGQTDWPRTTAAARALLSLCGMKIEVTQTSMACDKPAQYEITVRDRSAVRLRWEEQTRTVVIGPQSPQQIEQTIREMILEIMRKREPKDDKFYPPPT